MLKALVFDMDGTLCDSDHFHRQAFARALEPHGITVDADFYARAISGKSNEAIWASLLPDRTPEEQAREADRKEALFRELAVALDPAAGLLDLLAWAGRRSLRLALVTNAPRDNVDHMLEALGLAGRFPVVIASGDVPRSKPDPMPYRAALDRLGVAPHEAVAFEDSPPGLAAAVAAGIETVGITTGQSAEALLGVGAVLAAPHFDDPDLLSWLEGRAEAG